MSDNDNATNSDYADNYSQESDAEFEIEIKARDEYEDQNKDDSQIEGKIISIKKGKLLKLRHDVERLRKEFKAESGQITEWKNKTLKTTFALIGELNDNIKQEGS